MGQVTAAVTMVEFGDYQCPLCSRHFNWTMPKLNEEFIKSGKVRYVFKDFPLESIHPLALKAAEAARCAGEQDRYWEMHGRFFRNPLSLDVKILPLHAGMLSLDVARFQRCLNSGKHEAAIRESIEEGKRAGVRGVPAFFLGLTEPKALRLKALFFVNGAQPYGIFREAIEALLARQPAP